MNLQASYELEVAEDQKGQAVMREVLPRTGVLRNEVDRCAVSTYVVWGTLPPATQPLPVAYAVSFVLANFEYRSCHTIAIPVSDTRY